MNCKFKVVSIIFVLFANLLTIGCKKNTINPIIDGENLENKLINTWIKDSLIRYYYWSDQMNVKAQVQQDPINFFNEIKYKSDRFSYIYNPLKPESLPVYTRSKFGFEYSFIKLIEINKVIGIVKWVENDSPAGRIGLKRGDFFDKVNGIIVNENNISTLKDNILHSNNLTLSILNMKDDGEFNSNKDITINKGIVYEENFISNIISANHKRVGYLFFNQFTNKNKSLFVDEFEKFKKSAITDLILDLRYNTGGEVSCAAALCAMIIPGIKAEHPFIIYQGNINGGRRTESFIQSSMYNGGPSFSSYTNNNVALSNVYVLTTSSTASAAEIVINNLKPYINVIQIGETTRGKNEASILIQDQRSLKKIDYIMMPIVYKVFNKLGNGNYENGIEPQIFIDEFSEFPLKPIADSTERMLNFAIKRITTSNSAIAKISTKQMNIHRSYQTKSLYNSSTEENINNRSIANR